MNVLVFIAMAIAGVGLWSPAAQRLLGWGANYGPLTLNGQWWRVITSLFLHFGIMHLIFNMFVLLNIGPFMERLAGGTAYLILYFVAGIGGAAASMIWHPSLVSGGASGAIFGLYGGLLAFLLRYRSAIPEETVKSLLKGAAIFVGYNLIYGLTKPEIDMAAHLGGLVAGFGAGLFLIKLRGQDGSGAGALRYGLGIVVGAVMLSATVTTLPKPDDLQGEITRMEAMEKKSIALFNDSITRWKASQITEGQFTDILERQVLPPWRAEEQAIEKMQRLSSQQTKLARSLTGYMRAREDGWVLLLQGIRTNDIAKVRQSRAKGEQADSLAKSVGSNE